MTVKELIEKLGQFDPGLEVICSTEDEELLPGNHGLRLLDIEHLSVVEAEKRRGDDGVPSFKLRCSDLSQKHVVINVTSDF